jgi:hypothetical protein
MTDVYNVKWPTKMDKNGVDPDDPREWSVFDSVKNQVGGVYRVTKDRKSMQTAYGYNKFGDSCAVPEGSKFRKLNKLQRDHFCRDARPRPILDGLELKEWCESIKDECLTIQDVTRMENGEKIKVLLMDRNLYDTVCEVNKGNRLYSPEEFFQYKTATYTHDRDLKGHLICHWKDRDSKDYPFEFDIEYILGNWYPLKDGYLPKKDPQGFAKFEYSEPKHYSTFSNNTRIGWRGEMMLWSKINDTRKVFWYER